MTYELPIFVREALGESLNSIRRSFFTPLGGICRAFKIAIERFAGHFRYAPRGLEGGIGPSVNLKLNRLGLGDVRFLGKVNLRVCRCRRRFILGRERRYYGVCINTLCLPEWGNYGVRPGNA